MVWTEHFNSRRGRHMWVELVVGFFFALSGFSPGSSVFPSPQKPTFSNSNSTRNGTRKPFTVRMCYC